MSSSISSNRKKTAQTRKHTETHIHSVIYIYIYIHISTHAPKAAESVLLHDRSPKFNADWTWEDIHNNVKAS